MPTPGDRTGSVERIDASTVSTPAELATVLRRLRRREARRRQGRELTYHQLAAVTGWSSTIIGAYLTGAAVPPTDRFDRLVVVLGAEADERGPLATARDRVADARRHERSVAPVEANVPDLPPPRQLPGAPTQFVGRDDALARLDAAALERAASEAPVLVISGMAGVGKTALALAWAHRVAALFPDGQLYVDLGGFSSNDPVDPIDALAGFLRSLNPDGSELPADPELRAAAYRTLLSQRRVLVLLDNALTAEQVRPLLPGSPLCTVLVTSRDSLPGLVAVDGATRVALDLLSTEDATVLLRRLIGDRVDATPDAAASLVASCGHLPLAIRVAAEVAARRTAVPLRDLVNDLSDEATRLDTLDTGEPRTAVRTVLSWSHRALSPAAGRLLRLLGVAPVPQLTVSSIASLGGLGPADTRRLVTELDRANLLVEATPGRYLLHDVLRAYTAELARTHLDPADRAAAAGRLLDHYLHTAARADRLLDPGRWPVELGPPADGAMIDPLDSVPEGLRWFEAERSALVAAVQVAARLGDADRAWQLTWAMTTYFDRAGYWRELAAANALSLTVTTDPVAVGRLHTLSARAALRLGRVEAALEHHRLASQIYERLGDEVNQALNHSAMGKCLSESGAVLAALEHHRRALELFRRHANVAGQASTLNNIGFNLARLGNYSEALPFCQEAITLARQLGNRKGEAHCADSLGYIRRGLGEHERAIEHYHRAVALFVESGAKIAQASAWTSLGDTYAETGNLEAARDAWQFALEIHEQLDGDGDGADATRLRIASGSLP